LATKMLASTVQFSSYGRSRSPPAAYTACSRAGGAVQRGPVRIRDGSPRLACCDVRSERDRGSVVTEVRAPCGVSIPQDPTARLGHSPAASPVPAGKPAVLGMSATRSRPTGQCSTREPHPESERLRPEF
jgi:hypothetical protein